MAAILGWDWTRDFHDDTLVESLERVLPPPQFRFGPCEWERPWKGSGPAWRCGVASNAPLDMAGLTERMQAGGWHHLGRFGDGRLFCRGNVAARFTDLGSPPPFARVFDMHATRYHAGVQAGHLDGVARACRSAAYGEPSRRAATAPAPLRPSPACTLLPLPLRESCR